MKLEAPGALRAQHEELHAELAEATRAGGRTGEAARAVAELLRVHTAKEEKYAMPPLGILPLLGAGQITPEMEAVLSLTEKLKTELPRMLEEHDAIVGALEHLAGAARQEGREDYVRFAEKVKLHARSEEEVLYPAVLLIGEYLKLRLNKA